MHKKKYEYMKIGLASPEVIRGWSHGEVKKHETINYRSLKPERDGLFCEVIFGPTKDYQCSCAKPKRPAGGPAICEKCGIELTESKVRRERMGHIELAAPVVHTWYLKNSPSKIALLLDMKTKEVEDIVYLASYIVVDPGNVEEFTEGRILTEQEYSRFRKIYGSSKFRALTGAEAIKHFLKRLNLPEMINDLHVEVKTATKQRREKIIKRLDVLEAFNRSGNKPEWMVLDVVPVLPPDLRPMVQLDGGRFATTDLNDLYRRILNRNNRLKKQYEVRAPSLITKNEKRMLQEAVDALIDNSKRGKRAVMEKNRVLKSLSDILRGKQGRFRQNLLGKRVDYSGRSVIAVGPNLKMYQCGIPREMALILFKPFIIHALLNKEEGNTLADQANRISPKKAKEMIDEGHPAAMTELEKIIIEHPILLNRAPTLHRLGIQAFEPKLVEGKAIRLHPLATTAFNADFDGDQMAVHVPLSEEAQTEARLLMLASKNILAPKDGAPIVTPSQDMVLGNYYLTIEDASDKREGKIFKDFSEAEIAYESELIGFHTRFAIPAVSLNNLKITEEQQNKYLITTYGKLLFNTIFPITSDYDKVIPFIVENSDENLHDKTPDKFFVSKGTDIKKHLAQNKVVPRPFPKKFLSKIIAEVFKRFQISETSKTLDKMKDLGFKYSTISGITVSISDIEVIEGKDEIILGAENKIKNIKELFEYGALTEEGRKKETIDVWTKAKISISELISKDVEEKYTENHIYMMSDSGARGNLSNFVQLSGMRGLMAKPNGENMDVPIKSAFIEGLTMSEFFVSTHGSRKGSTDTALKTAESGYLTRRLVDVCQDVIVSEEDCQTDKGMLVKAIYESDEIEKKLQDAIKQYQKDPKNNLPPNETKGLIVSLKDRILGRYTSKTVYHPKTKAVLLKANELIDVETAALIVDSGVKEVWIRTLLTCNSRNGVCVKCYGSDLSTGKKVEKGEVVGIVAAQSIGEPGTQLTMRTFHTGGVAGGEDITQGLPRIQELFEARQPKGKAIISEIDGKIKSIEHKKDNRYEIIVINERINEEKKYLTDSGKILKVVKNQVVKAGDRLTEGLTHPKELLRVSSTDAVENYILKEVQKVYRSQGVGIADKHIEIIIKQMLKKVQVVNEGDTDLLAGSFISRNELADNYYACIKEQKNPPIVKPVLLGITRASLKSDSFLSSASFQETTRVLTEAAIRGKIDYLEGLKENIIIGGLIPAGTGLIDGDYEINPDIDLDTGSYNYEDEAENKQEISENPNFMM